jgi:hypothetical protein
MLPDKKHLNGVSYAGKPVYIVTFKYDTTKESLVWNYAAKVYILQESSYPLNVFSVTALGIIFLTTRLSTELCEVRLYVTKQESQIRFIKSYRHIFDFKTACNVCTSGFSKLKSVVL